MKDSVKSFILPGSRKVVDPSSNHHHEKFVGFIMMSCRHAKAVVASWGSGGTVRSPGQSLRGDPGVGAHRSSETPGVSISYNENRAQ